MKQQVPSRRLVASVAVVAALAAALLTALLTVNGGPAGAASSRTASTVHATTATASGDPLLRRLLQQLGRAQGIGRGGRSGRPISPLPTVPTFPTSSAAPSAPASTAPASSAPSSTDPASTAPSSSSTPSSSAPSSSAPSSSSSAPTSSDPTVAGDNLVWSDEFDGAAGSAPNQKMWNANIGGKYGSHELECYTNDRDNSSLDGQGDLNITARYTPGHQCTDATNDYTSARLTTQGLAASQYGKLRVRAKLPSASGLWPAIWLMGTDIDKVGWPQCGEVDVMEAIGKDLTSIYGTVIGPKANGGSWQTNHSPFQLDSPMSDAYHVYGLDWTPTQLTISVDGHDYTTISKDQVLAAGNQWVFDKPFFVLLNVAVGGDWPGAPKSNAVFPQTMSVDYVRVYN